LLKRISPMTDETPKSSTDDPPRNSVGLYAWCALLMAAILMADLAVPLRVAVGVPHIIVVLLLSPCSPDKRLAVLVAAILSLLVVAAFWAKPAAGELWKVRANRAAALLAIWVTTTLILQRKRLEDRREMAIRDRERALEEVKVLRGFLPICDSCKKNRDDRSYWTQMEAHIRDDSEAEFSHGICPECFKKLYPEFHRDDVPRRFSPVYEVV